MTRTAERKPTERVRLTLERIRKLSPPAGGQAVYVFDESPKQLCVRVTPAGAKSFVFATKLGKAPLRTTIGSVDVWNLDDARDEARRLQTLVDKNIDPRELVREQRAAKEAAKQAVRDAAEAKRAAAEAARIEAERQARYSLRALCDAYVGILERGGKAKSAAEVRSSFRCHVCTNAEIADTPARDVTPDQIVVLIRKVREAGKERAAGILRSYLLAAFNVAKRARLDSELPADLIQFEVEHNPVIDIPAIGVKKGDRRLSADELRAYIGHLLRIGQETGPELADVALLLALLSGGQRMAQLLRAKVADFDADTATLRLLDGKGKRKQPREHLVPLAPEAAGIVTALVERARTRELARAKAEGRAPNVAGCWLFSTRGHAPMTVTTPGKRAADISASMAGEPFDLRDIRRTVETMLAALAISKDTRAQLLSHGISGVQAAHYDRHTYADEKRAALLAWERKLKAIRLAERAPSNVVRLGHRAA